jgi:DNA-binding transcriptional ArsR family regulator
LTARTKTSKSNTQRLVETLAHPIRLEALRIFSYQVASPSEIASELHLTLGSLTYHVKVLRDFGCIESVRTEQVRGATEHFYRAVLPPHFEDKDWVKLPQVQREEVSAMVFQALFGEVLRAFHQRTFDARENRHMSWLPMELDEQGWRELVAKQLELLMEEIRIKVESAERLRAEGKSGKRVVAVILGFETPPGFGFLPPEG